MVFGQGEELQAAGVMWSILSEPFRVNCDPYSKYVAAIIPARLLSIGHQKISNRPFYYQDSFGKPGFPFHLSDNLMFENPII